MSTRFELCAECWFFQHLGNFCKLYHIQRDLPDDAPIASCSGAYTSKEHYEEVKRAKLNEQGITCIDCYD